MTVLVHEFVLKWLITQSGKTGITFVGTGGGKDAGFLCVPGTVGETYHYPGS